jgi:hypothetical protein
VAPAQVAEWAGRSVEVLLRSYARCLDGQHDIAKRRIMEALDGPAPDGVSPRAARPTATCEPATAGLPVEVRKVETNGIGAP